MQSKEGMRVVSTWQRSFGRKRCVTSAIRSSLWGRPAVRAGLIVDVNPKPRGWHIRSANGAAIGLEVPTPTIMKFSGPPAGTELELAISVGIRAMCKSVASDGRGRGNHAACPAIIFVTVVHAHRQREGRCRLVNAKKRTQVGARSIAIVSVTTAAADRNRAGLGIGNRMNPRHAFPRLRASREGDFAVEKIINRIGRWGNDIAKKGDADDLFADGLDVVCARDRIVNDLVLFRYVKGCHIGPTPKPSRRIHVPVNLDGLRVCRVGAGGVLETVCVYLPEFSQDLIGLREEPDRVRLSHAGLSFDRLSPTSRATDEKQPEQGSPDQQ